MKKVILSFFVLLTVLVGCEKESKSQELYSGLDAEETYLAMVEYMNENITYFKEQKEVERYDGSKLVGNTEVLFKDDKVYVIDKSVDEEEKLGSFFVRDNTQVYNLYKDINDQFAYFSRSVEKVEGIVDNVLENSDYKVIDLKRKDKNGKIYITVRRKYLSVDGYSEIEFEIGSEGYYTQLELTNYDSDEEFKEKSLTIVYKILDVNKKDDIDIKGAIKEIEKLAAELVVE